MRKLVSQSEFGRLQGVSHQRVSQWVRDGIITLTCGKVDIERAQEELRKNLDGLKKYDWEECQREKNRWKDEPLPSLNLDFPNLEYLKKQKPRKKIKK